MTDHIESYTTGLARRLKDAPPQRKGERTRERIKLAAARVLERVGFHAMRVSDITKAAKTSDGSFYIYFKDKKDVALTVLQEFLEGIQLAGDAAAGQPRAPFASIQHANIIWIRTVRANAGLMRSVFQMSDEDDAFSRLVHSSNRAWYDRVARSVIKNHPDIAVDERAVLLAVWALGCMMDEIMRRVVVYPDTEFVAFLEQEVPDDEALAEALTVIWHRVLYPDVQLPSGLEDLALSISKLTGTGANAR